MILHFLGVFGEAVSGVVAYLLTDTTGHHSHARCCGCQGQPARATWNNYLMKRKTGSGDFEKHSTNVRRLKL